MYIWYIYIYIYIERERERERDTYKRHSASNAWVNKVIFIAISFVSRWHQREINRYAENVLFMEFCHMVTGCNWSNFIYDWKTQNYTEHEYHIAMGDGSYFLSPQHDQAKKWIIVSLSIWQGYGISSSALLAPLSSCPYHYSDVIMRCRDAVSNHRRLDCLLNRLFRRRSNKTSKLHVTGLSEGNSSVTSDAEKVSIWWRHHAVHLKWMCTRFVLCCPILAVIQ